MLSPFDLRHARWHVLSQGRRTGVADGAAPQGQDEVRQLRWHVPTPANLFQLKAGPKIGKKVCKNVVFVLL